MTTPRFCRQVLNRVSASALNAIPANLSQHRTRAVGEYRDLGHLLRIYVTEVLINLGWLCGRMEPACSEEWRCRAAVEQMLAP